MKSMKPATIQPEVVESPDMPIWAKVAEDLHGKLSTHISSQEESHEDPPEWLKGNAVIQAPFTCNECPSKWMEKVHWGEIPRGS